MAIRYNLVISFELHLFGSWITTTGEANNNITKPIDSENRSMRHLYCALGHQGSGQFNRPVSDFFSASQKRGDLHRHFSCAILIDVLVRKIRLMVQYYSRILILPLILEYDASQAFVK